MILAHLYQQYIRSPTFITQQLHFQHQIFKHISQQCHQQPTPNAYHACTAQYQNRINKYALLVQYLINSRQKMLEVELRACSQQMRASDEADDGEDERMLVCVNQKAKIFVRRYLEKDAKYFELVREQLLK